MAAMERLDAVPWTVKQLLDINKNERIKAPPYQRGLRWSSVKRLSFVNSLKNHYPFGAITLFELPEKGFLVIDGYQRLRTIIDLCERQPSYFQVEDIEDDFVALLLPYMTSDKLCAEEKISRIKDCIIDVIQNYPNPITKDIIERTEFSTAQKWNQHDFVTAFIKWLERKGYDITQAELLRNDEGKKDEILQHLTKIQESFKLDLATIPMVIVSGSEDQLPEIYRRINQEGLKLSEYEVCAATWSGEKVKTGIPDIPKLVSDRYDRLEKSGFEIEGYDREEYEDRVEFDYFEYLTALGEYLRKTHPRLFSDSDATSIAFILFTLCSNNRISEMRKLPNFARKYPGFNVASFESGILSSVKLVDTDLIKGLLDFGFQTSALSNPPHTEYQIAALIAKSFFLKYKLEFNAADGRLAETGLAVAKRESWKQRMLRFYVYELFDRSFWQGPVDTKAFNLVSPSVNDHHYDEDISKDEMVEIIDEWHANQTREVHKRRNVNKQKKLFLALVYSHKFPGILAARTQDCEHVIPIKTLTQKFQTGGPINAAGNLGFLNIPINRAKGDMDIFTFLKNSPRPGYTIQNAESDLFTTENDVQSLLTNLTVDTYAAFEEKRYRAMRDFLIDKLYP